MEEKGTKTSSSLSKEIVSIFAFAIGMATIGIYVVLAANIAQVLWVDYGFTLCLSMLVSFFGLAALMGLAGAILTFINHHACRALCDRLTAFQAKIKDMKQKLEDKKNGK